jgi:hypothetical protein
VRVLVDGRVLPNVEGPIALDPGVRVFRFEPAVGTAVETREEVHAGEREHLVSVVLEVPAEADSPSQRPVATEPARARSRTPSWILGGVGVLTLTAAGVLAVKGHVDRGTLRSECAPYCDQGEVDFIRGLWLASGGLAAVGVLSVVAAAVLWPRAPSARVPSLAFSSRGIAAAWPLP